jgi:hypothetical protein
MRNSENPWPSVATCAAGRFEMESGAAKVTPKIASSGLAMILESAKRFN